MVSPAPVTKDLGKGCVELKFRDLKHFVDYLYSDMLDFEAYVWRGQKCDNWELEPTLDRLIRTSKKSGRKLNWNFADKHLECFKYAIRGRRGPNPPQVKEENDWWALGQHHGLATPLLDWSHSPFVAAFFAFHELDDIEQTSNRAIFALHQPSVERMAKLKARLEKAERKEEYDQLKATGKLSSLAAGLLQVDPPPNIVFVRPLSDENSRLVSQRGLFTRNYTKQSIEGWVKENQESNDDSYTLMKFLVPNADRSKCLQLLNRMNINPLSLFPDLSGASQYCNLVGQIEDY